jgi:eukaryotic-like serine/threonine-protein kinase
VALTPGTRLGVYEITAPLGEGGMGEVYRATDTSLKRQVAIKVLPASVAADADRLARFQREAEVLAQLNHPNIAAIYGLEQSGATPALVMELVDGPTLAGRLTQGAIPVDEALPMARQIADALTAAHAQGIVHRDLKPANIKVRRDGTVKVLDFGLAKAIDRNASSATADGMNDVAETMTRHAMTQVGMILGTAAYMSPEQAEGKAVDRRSDIFSFGAVLYEMVTGRAAFGGDSMARVVSSVLRDEPRASGGPAAVAEAIRRCLEKRPEDRFASMADVHAALDAAAKSTSTAQEQPSIAVLPFVNMSADPDQEYFSDGLAEEIINALAHVRGLRVIARTSAFAFKGQNTDVRRIAETLGVATVLEGSVRKAGHRIRVTAQLITARDGSHLWSQRYDRDLEDIFVVQDEIAVAIADALKVTLSSGHRALQTHQPSLPAYEAFLRYRHHQWSFTPESMQKSRECLEDAIRLDPDFALAYVGLADNTMASPIVGAVPGQEAMPQVRQLARRALELDPDLPEGHGMLGVVAALHDLDWPEATRRFERAMAQEPVHWHLRLWYIVFFLVPLGRSEEAVRQGRLLVGDNPLSQICWVELAEAYASGGHDEEALAAIRKSQEVDPGFWWAAAFGSLLHGARGEHDAARACAEKAMALAPWSPLSAGAMAGVLHHLGDRAGAQAVLDQFGPDEAYRLPLAQFFCAVIAGDLDTAVTWATRAIDERFPAAPLLVMTMAPRLCHTAGWPRLRKTMRLPDA